MKKILKLLGCLIVPQIAGVIGGIFTARSVPTWYAGLNKPSFNPPNGVFSPVWITLFVLMGLALYLVLETQSHEKQRALMIFAGQLCLNVLWTIVFFGMHAMTGGMAVIVVLWGFILWNIVLFYRISKPAGMLLVPYILWVSFAMVLNGAFIVLNR